MLYLVARFDLLVTQSRSLKEKRAVVQRLKARWSQRMAASVSEVDHQDVHQRAALGLALVVHRESSGRDALALARSLVEQEPRVTILEVRSHLGRLEDEAEPSWQELSDDPDPEDEYFGGAQFGGAQGEAPRVDPVKGPPDGPAEQSGSSKGDIP